MDSTLHFEKNHHHLYMEVYEFYKNQILNFRIPAGSKMPSLRKCAEERKLSRTTVENAYLQLAADGYIIAKAQSGYFVTDIASRHHPHPASSDHPRPVPYRYDFASSGVDRSGFRFDLWQRYIKSALRQDERMLSYGEPQGEYDFRETLAEYVRVQRNILCSAENIVIGAGVQNLLQILCPLLKDRRTVSFPNSSFLQGCTVFQDYGFETAYRNKNCDIIYVSPAHMTKWGEVMPVSRRMELVRHAAASHRLIIEDDYENEFVYLQKPTPSLYGLSGGENVIYIGSFSRLLLPSIRISFMILPLPLLEKYRKKASFYNQTASKTEQIALCQFIRDGHLAAQTRKLKRLYSHKLRHLLEALQQVFGENCRIRIGAAGTSVAVTLPRISDGPAFLEKARAHGLNFQLLSEKSGQVSIILSCSAMKTEDFLPACQLLASLCSS